MTDISASDGEMTGCIGLPLEQALDYCRRQGLKTEIVYTGERAAEDSLTPRVIALNGNRLLVSYFRDGDPSEAL